MSELDKRKAEFEKYIWNHIENPMLEEYDIPPGISDGMLSLICEMARAAYHGNEEEVKKLITKGTYAWKESFIFLILQLVGSTRQKIRTDLAPIAKELDISVPTAHKNFINSKIWPAALSYMASKFIFVFAPIGKEPNEKIIETINRATWPGYVRQEKAKRSGHACEQRLAKALYDAEILFEPEEKLTNPMCPDILIQDESFDIVVPDWENPLLCFKSTVHTANIGQYGESKDHLEIRTALEKFEGVYGDQRPVIMALIDGVGLRTNVAGLNGVLENADEFCQFKTLWKAVVVASWCLDDDELKIYLKPDDFIQFDDFLIKYGYDKKRRLKIAPENPIIIGSAVFTRDEL